MSTSTFDTHASFKALTAAGLSEAQAEAIIESQQRALDQSEVATKRDLHELELVLKKDIAEAKADIIKWVVSAGVLQTAVIAGLVMALTK